MENLEKDIIKLYLDSLFSVQQVAEKLKISSSKARYVLKKNKIIKRNIGEAIRCLNVTKFKKGEFKIKENLNSVEEKLKVSGTMLYWGEGTKSGGTVTFSNSDPVMIKLFIKFLRNICGVAESRLRALLHVYSDQDEKKLKYFWSKITNIPESQFSKSFVHTKKGGNYKKNSQYGTMSLRYSDKQLLIIINNWIKEVFSSI
jgi:hypothetical protein